MRYLVIFIIGLGFGGCAGGLAGDWHGKAVTLQAQFAYQSGLMAGLAEDVHPEKHHH